MPRRNRRRDDAQPQPLIAPNLDAAAPPGWHARAISPARALKTYRCPYCNQDIKPGTAHVVAWRDGQEDLRRHWHTPCWRRDANTLR